MKIRVGILTVSDRSFRGERLDASGPVLEEIVRAQRWLVADQAILPDDLEMLSKLLERWADSGEIDVILTTGGTGFAPRDITPEATQAIIDRKAPGLAEAMRASSLLATPHAMLSRAITGMRGKCLIVNLPGSPKAAKENFQVIIPVLPHAVQLLNEDSRAEEGHQLD